MYFKNKRKKKQKELFFNFRALKKASFEKSEACFIDVIK